MNKVIDNEKTSIGILKQNKTKAYFIPLNPVYSFK